MRLPKSVGAVCGAGAAFPAAQQWFTQIKGLLPIVGDAWVYTFIAVVLGVVLADDRDLALAQFLSRREETPVSWFRTTGSALVIAALVALLAYYVVERRTRENAAFWVYVFFPVLYAVVLGTTSLGLTWLGRAAATTSRKP